MKLRYDCTQSGKTPESKKEDPMDIYAQPGNKVRFTNPNAGYPRDQEIAKKHLKLGKNYTVRTCKLFSY